MTVMKNRERVQRIVAAQDALNAFVGRAVVMGQQQIPTPPIDESWGPTFRGLQTELRDAIEDLMAHRGEPLD